MKRLKTEKGAAEVASVPAAEGLFNKIKETYAAKIIGTHKGVGKVRKVFHHAGRKRVCVAGFSSDDGPSIVYTWALIAEEEYQGEAISYAQATDKKVFSYEGVQVRYQDGKYVLSEPLNFVFAEDGLSDDGAYTPILSFWEGMS